MPAHAEVHQGDAEEGDDEVDGPGGHARVTMPARVALDRPRRAG